MPPIARENDTVSSTRDSAAQNIDTNSVRDEAAQRQQTVALEVPVTVNGARAVDGSDKREPFSESTKTVLVFGNGAVIRLGSGVAPGQLLFLTNDKSKKEVVCQVVKSKKYRDVSGYVELEFTEPVAGFWGMRFPGERAGSHTTASAALTSLASPPIPPKPELLAALPNPLELTRSSSVTEAKSEPAVLPPFVKATTEAVQAFKAELRADDRSANRVELFASASDNSAEALKIQASPLQERLSSLLSSDNPSPEVSSSAASTSHSPEFGGGTKFVNTVSGEAAVGKEQTSRILPDKKISSTEPSMLEVEEVKVPAWLEPLARNVAGKPAPHESASKDAGLRADVPSSLKPKEGLGSETAMRRESRKSSPSVFGKTLLESSTRRSGPSGGNRGILVATIVAAVLVSVAAATWYLRQPSNLEQSTVSETTLPIRPSPVDTPSAAESSAVHSQAQSGAPLQDPVVSAKQASVAEVSPAQPKVQPAVISERIAKPEGIGNDAVKSGPTIASERSETASIKPVLGKVRLAKPKVSRNARNQTGVMGVTEPELETNGDHPLPNEDALGAGLVSDSTSQPTAPPAPTPVGGDVKPAQMISSVPPSYPAMARAQRIAGDVRIDALIDSNGHVSSMKVMSGPSLLHQAAMDALRRWKYQPATLDGKPVPMHLTVTIQFRLK